MIKKRFLKCLTDYIWLKLGSNPNLLQNSVKSVKFGLIKSFTALIVNGGGFLWVDFKVLVIWGW